MIAGHAYAAIASWVNSKLTIASTIANTRDGRDNLMAMTIRVQADNIIDAHQVVRQELRVFGISYLFDSERKNRRVTYSRRFFSRLADVLVAEKTAGAAAMVSVAPSTCNSGILSRQDHDTGTLRATTTNNA